MGKILRVDLGSKNFSTEDLDPELEEKYIGGAGVAVAIFINEVPPKVDPLDRQNPFSFSVLQPQDYLMDMKSKDENN